MKCSKANHMLQLYIDKQLTLEQIRRLEEHVYACPECREELFLLEEIGRSLNNLELIAEPADLTMNIMRRVALSNRHVEAQLREQQRFALFRPTLVEVLSAVVLATVAMLGIIVDQTSILAALPGANGHSAIALFFITVWDTLVSMNSEILMLGLWVLGTALGIWITLLVAGSDMRNEWFRAMMDRLPVW